ncbi:hypothetical protein [Calycomorphotria hydatis]|uniref:Uncharacterized protein n=1 Tax=Calycomorphotria hydatis TaxID=2528027 RepID=A0A517T8E6_9PLAN|nr:hypothetical protein [Calycomorphotria hydatis]QDT64644.1 hypothetical protein V22_18840 [Calycomorphotria hydatis]
MNISPHVLVVDGLQETEQVLKAALEPQGHTVGRVRAYDHNLLPDESPRVLVMHEESGESSKYTPNQIPRVVIGSFEVQSSDTPSVDRHLRSPFDYRDLVGAVQALLQAEADKSDMPKAA